jgi:hypothetical protein
MPERMTKDLDVLVRYTDGPAAIARLVGAGYTVISDLAVPGKLVQAPDGAEVDVLWVPVCHNGVRQPNGRK